MDNNNTRIEHLWHQFNAKLASPAELEELFAALDRPELDPAHRQTLLNILAETPPRILGDEPWREMAEAILAADQSDQQLRPVRRIRRRRWIAAATVTLLLGFGAWFYLSHRPMTVNTAPVAAAHDLSAPAANRAHVTLATGQTVYLDSAANGTLATQSGTQLVKLHDGQIAYQGGTNNNAPAVYNTLINPRGSKVVTLTLSDGTRVWLNAESSLRYPVAFGGESRTVSITGEAYFEVSPDKAHPFTVQKDNIEVRVLGTRFNIKAYPGEKETRITLVDGAVRVAETRSGQVKTLRPGEQARIGMDATSNNIGETIAVAACDDMDAVLAWKSGFFYFNAQSISAIMAELGRWYDATPVYQDSLSNLSFSARIRRDNNLSNVLKLFTATGNIRFRIEDKKIIIMK